MRGFYVSKEVSLLSSRVAESRTCKRTSREAPLAEGIVYGRCVSDAGAHRAVQESN